MTRPNISRYAHHLPEGKTYFLGGGLKAHLSEDGTTTLCGRDLAHGGYLASMESWEWYRERNRCCKECIRWEYHLRMPGARNPMLNVNASR